MEEPEELTEGEIGEDGLPITPIDAVPNNIDNIVDRAMQDTEDQANEEKGEDTPTDIDDTKE